MKKKMLKIEFYRDSEETINMKVYRYKEKFEKIDISSGSLFGSDLYDLDNLTPEAKKFLWQLSLNFVRRMIPSVEGSREIINYLFWGNSGASIEDVEIELKRQLITTRGHKGLSIERIAKLIGSSFDDSETRHLVQELVKISQ